MEQAIATTSGEMVTARLHLEHGSRASQPAPTSTTASFLSSASPPSARTRSSAATAAAVGQPKPTPSRAAANRNQVGRPLLTRRGDLAPH